MRVMKVSVGSEGQSAPLKDHSSGGVDWLNGFNLWVIWVLGDFRQFGKQNSCCRFSNGDVRYFQNGHFFFRMWTQTVISDIYELQQDGSYKDYSVAVFELCLYKKCSF